MLNSCREQLKRIVKCRGLQDSCIERSHPVVIAKALLDM